MKLSLCAFFLAAVLIGCGSADSGPATQGQVNEMSTELKKSQSNAPDVPIELRNKGMTAGGTGGAQGVGSVKKSTAKPPQ
jgi:hypothetical protein